MFSKLSNFLAKLILNVGITDHTNGFRIYSRRSVELIVKKCGKIGDGFIILSEILLNIYRNKLKIGEIHSTFRNRIRGESSVSRKEIMNSIIGLMKLYKIKTQLINY